MGTFVAVAPLVGARTLQGRLRMLHAAFFCSLIFWERISLAFSSLARRDALRPLPARLMKKVSIRMPERGPLGETFFEARERAISRGERVNRPSGGSVETVFTSFTQRCADLGLDFLAA